jgi:mono/diheme cytochrome c family protein
MRWFKLGLKLLGGLVGVALVVALGLFIYVQVKYKVDYPDTPLPQITARNDAETIARGEYIVHAVAHCSTCHGPKDLVHQHLVDFSKPLEGGHVWKVGMFGTFTARNLTPHETGIGKLSDGQLARTIRHGVDSRGKLSPFMRMAVGPMSDEDLTAVISWLRTQHAVEGKRDWYELGFLGKVVTLKLGPRMTPAPAHVPEGAISVERGKYLAEGPALCKGCHSPLDPLGGFALDGAPYSGAAEADEDPMNPNQEIIAPNLTPEPTTGHIASWSEDSFVARFKAGRMVPGSAMPWDGFTRLTENDVRSVYRYLRTLPPVKRHIGPTVRRK